MKTEVVSTKAPVPIGPFSQAVVAGNLVFVSAQFAMNPATGVFVMETIEAETAQVMDNIQAILQEAGCHFSQVVKSSIFLTDIQEYGKVNAVYSSYFKGPFPARETVQVEGLPKNVHIEISVIAAKD